MNNTKTFLPKDYKVPSSGGDYMKFKEGPNKLRALSSAIVGWEWWDTDNKPHRDEERLNEVPENAKKDKDGNTIEPKAFWAFVVWNYQTEHIEILEITQKSIMNGIQNLIQSGEWGLPQEYDLTVTRTGTDFNNTEYTVQPSVPAPASEEVLRAYEDNPINLNALYSGGNPFENKANDNTKK